MPAPRIAHLDSLVDRSRQRYGEVRRRVPTIDRLHRIVERYQDANGSLLAGYLAYRMFLLLVPLAAVLVALAGFSDRTASNASDHLGLGAAFKSTIAQAGSDAHDSRVPLLITGSFAFLYAAWGLLGAVQYIAAQAWQIPTRRFPHKSKAFAGFAGSLLLFGVIIYIATLVRKAGLLAGVAGSLATLASSFVAYLGLAWILPHRSREWFWLLPGAMVGAAAHLGLQAFATWILPNRLASASGTYGALGVSVTALGYLFLLGVSLTMAPIVNAVMWEQSEDEPPGILRRIADRVPIPTTAIGSGYVPPGETVEVPRSTPPTPVRVP